MDNRVSIILPTYNRAHFLPDALDSIQQQLHRNWELIIVDDGSTDGTERLIPQLSSEINHPIAYIKQANQGPAAARNTGLKHARGDFIAFYDSDDLWLPHHLSDILNSFQHHPTLDWIYASCQRISYETNEILQASTFYTNGSPNQLFSVTTKAAPPLYFIDTEAATLLQIKDCIDSGLQNSVIRAKLFCELTIPNFRIGEDRLLITMALKKKFNFAFIDKVSVLYRVHDGNLSDTNGSESDIDKRAAVLNELIDSYRLTSNYIQELSSKELYALNQRIANDMFWKLGYALLWQSGRYLEAVKAFRKAIQLTPFNIKFLKTYLLCEIRRLATHLRPRLKQRAS